MIRLMAALLGYYSSHERSLTEAREQFRAGQINEWRFRGKLRRLGYTQYGIDREIEDQTERIVHEGRRV